jgi:transcriptional regulator with XRE-family HTH domain
MNKQNHDANDERLLQLHQLHLGLYARVAKRLSVNPSYVSRVAQGERTNERIKMQLLNELRKIKRAEEAV